MVLQMFVVLPFIAFLLLVLIFQSEVGCLRRAILSAAVVWGVILTAMTEVLSLFDFLSFAWVLAGWLLVTGVLCVILVQRTAVRDAGLKLVPTADWGIDSAGRQLLVGVGLLALISGTIAIVSPPNTWDSMTYHMSRVMHWIQNGSLLPYPTNCERQLFLNPGAEFAVCHLQVLSGGDRFANMVQWFAMIGTLVGVSLVAGQLGADPFEQIMAVVFAGTLPMGILQASSTQTDYVVSFWLTCFIYFGLLVSGGGISRFDRTTNVLAGAALGLGVLAKATAYIFAFPFVLWFMVRAWKRARTNAWKTCLIVVIVASCLNLGYWERNLMVYGSPTAPQAYSKTWVSEAFGVKLAVSNVIRHASLHFGTPFPPVNKLAEDGVLKLHSLINANIDDRRTTFSPEYLFPRLNTDEDETGNPIHMLLACYSLGACLCLRTRVGRDGLYYACCSLIGFVLLCMMIKWHPWVTRFHLVSFVFSAPLVGIAVTRGLGRKAALVIAALLLVCALPFALYCESRPLIGRDSVLVKDRVSQYFAKRPELERPYRVIAKQIKARGCESVGLQMADDDWEYPWWVLLDSADHTGPRIEHVVGKDATPLPPSFTTRYKQKPQCIISTLNGNSERIETQFGAYVRVFGGPIAGLFVPAQK